MATTTSHPEQLRMADESAIGKYIQYAAGPLAGRCVRSELQAYQKPDLGRKFAKRDRRPLDPPPVIRLRMYELLDAGLPTQRELEIPAEDIDISGLVAHIDLFSVEPPPSTTTDEPAFSARSSESPTGGNQERHSITPMPNALVRPAPQDTNPGPSNATPYTHAVFGSSFVHGVQMEWRGEPVVFFVFSDLSVRYEGYFCMRYRCFDLFSRTAGSDDVPIAAELYSGTFVIYSTKEFPGLQASTALTKHLSRWGVRVNLRENDRRKPTEDSSDEEESAEVGLQPPKKRLRSPGR